MHSSKTFIGAAVAALLAAGCDRADAPAPGASSENAAAAAAAQPPVVRAAGDSTLAWAPCPSPFPAGCELTVLHGDPAKPNADVLLRVPAGYALPPHTHSSAERMVLVSGRLQVRYQGAPEATLTPGTYAFGPAGLPHRASCTSPEPCQLFVAFEGPVDVVPHEGEIG